MAFTCLTIMLGKKRKMNTKLIVRVIFFFTIWIAMFLSNPLMYACTGFMMSDE